jgi:hypothetical protein
MLEEGAARLSSEAEPDRGKGAPLPPALDPDAVGASGAADRRERWWRGERWRHEEREKGKGKGRRRARDQGEGGQRQGGEKREIVGGGEM